MTRDLELDRSITFVWLTNRAHANEITLITTVPKRNNAATLTAISLCTIKTMAATVNSEDMGYRS